MAYNNQGAPSSGIWDAVKGALGIFDKINKTEGFDENSNPQPQDVFKSDLEDTKILELISNWKRTYNTYYRDIEGSQKIAFGYWIGKQDINDAGSIQGDKTIVDNQIFEAVETFIPIATRTNPDPVVRSEPTPLGQKVSHDVKEALVYTADKVALRKVFKKALRHWIIYKIGVLKHGYNPILEKIEIEAVNPKLMIFDKDGWIDEKGNFTGEYLGQKLQNSAEKLIQLFPESKDRILEKAKGKLGTKIEYISWWYQGRDNFYTMDDNIVLGKFKNPHWNYDTPEGFQGKNHFEEPLAPYTFLGIFTTGLQPHDETSLITQNIGLQDMVNRRYNQIDDNVKKMNNGLVVSSEFTSEQASQAASALARGIAIRAPTQDVSKAVMRLPAAPIPPQVFQMLEDGRQQIKNIFGTGGSTPSGLNRETTARGKILVNQLDTSRIGGGITEFLEQVADTTYNWWTQFMYVHWTEEQYIISSGQAGSNDVITLKNTDFATLRSLIVTVKEGSLIPKDPLTQRNEAMDLWSANAIDPITLARKLDMPDPLHYAEQLIIWQKVQNGTLPPEAYIPNFMSQQALSNSSQLPTQGVGSNAVNPIGGLPTPEAPSPASPPALEQESKDLMSSVPI